MEKEQDWVGYQTLDILNKAQKFNLWLYDKISRSIGNTVLEIGSGIGTTTSLIKAEKVIATDYSEQYLNLLKCKYEANPSVIIRKLDAANREDFVPCKDMSIDTVLCCNVLEHIRDDYAAIANFSEILVSGGKLILLVPYSQKLYCNYDKNLGHFRRYSRSSLKKVVETNGLRVENIFLFNLFGGLGWLLFGKILMGKQLKRNTIGLYEKLVPIFKMVEKYGTPFGASIICIARKL